MAIIVNFAGASLLVPGAYSDVNPASSGLASPSLGVIAIIGEAEEGPAFSQESGLSAVTFGPEEFSAIQDAFGSGELVDAAKLAINPSNDPSIQGGAQELIVIKTNASTTSELILPAGASSYGKVKAKKAGDKGNSISAEVSIVGAKAIIKISNLMSGITEVSDELGGNAVMSIQCTDADSTECLVSLDAAALTTTVSAQATVAQALAIPLKNFSTVKQLADFINSQPGYSASVASAALGSKPVSILDKTSAADCKASAHSFKKDAAEVAEFFAKSSMVKFEATAASGLPTSMAKKFLSGGSKGHTSNANIQDALDALLKRRVNFIVPLFSRDASADIAESLTDAASTYDIDTILAATRAHVNQASTVRGRKERHAFCGFKGSYEATSEAAANLSSARVQLHFCDVDVFSSSQGANVSKQPHMSAVIAAGMKAGAAVGEPNTFKQPAIFGFSHPEFDPETQAEKAIKDNLCFPEKAPAGGFRFVLDNSTYSLDANAWIFNRPSVLYAADTAAYAIRLNSETFVGRRNSDVSAESVKNLLVEVFDNLRSSGIIVGDAASKGKGYKDLSVKIQGSIVYINVTLVLVEGLEFVLSDIKVQRAA